MAKRRRLTPFDPEAIPPPAASHPRDEPAERAAGPIARVAGDASAHAALDALAGEMSAARAGGRMIEAVPLERIDPDHLIRDRMSVDEDDMEALVESLRARGQKTPIEVVALQSDRYGLISGWRRFQALERLHDQTGEARFATVAALVRTPASAAEAYLGMVEENEIRAGLSYYERARLAAEAARIGVHPNTSTAIAALYARASASKRSKIANFVTVHEHLGVALRHGMEIPERLGLALAAALQMDERFGPHLRDMLRDLPDDAPDGVTAERAVLEGALKAKATPPRKTSKKACTEELAPGLFLEVGRERAIVSGPALDAETITALRDWMTARR